MAHRLQRRVRSDVIGLRGAFRAELADEQDRSVEERNPALGVLLADGSHFHRQLDSHLVAGAPAERRRYLDIALCQISPAYCRSLGEYNRIVTQRNALLKRLREHGGDANQLAFWDAQLAEHGSVLVHRRVQIIRQLEAVAADRHRDLTGGGERLLLGYVPGVDLSAPGRTGGNGQASLNKRWLAEELRRREFGRCLARGRCLSIWEETPRRSPYALTACIRSSEQRGRSPRCRRMSRFVSY